MGPLAPCIETYIRKLDPLKYRPEWVHMAYHLQGAYQHFGRYDRVVKVFSTKSLLALLSS